MTPREIIEQAGLEYKGLQERPRGQAPLHLFNEPKGSTLALEFVTEEMLCAKIKEHEAVCKKAKE